MKHNPTRGPSQRQLRAGQVVRRVLVEILERGDMADPILSRVPLTIGEVRMSPDLKHATAFVSPFSVENIDERQAIINALNKAAPKIQKQLGQKVRLKFTPFLRFLFDTSYDEAQHIDQLIKGLNHKVQNNGGQ